MSEFAYRDDRAGKKWRVPNIPIAVERPADLCGEVARLLAAGKIVGWFQGGSEFGPRALGGRSILADPRSPQVHQYLNDHVKHRQWFRPYAPAVLLERLSEWFELNWPSPHMLLVAPVRPEKRGLVPAIVHADGTARIQTVAPGEGPFREVIERFFALTGVPIVLNTSFNDHGEPIVETVLDAYQCFATTAIDALAIGLWLVTKEPTPLQRPSPRNGEGTGVRLPPLQLPSPRNGEGPGVRLTPLQLPPSRGGRAERYILGAVISDHDSSVALVADGRRVAAINEERLCRVRRGDPRNSVRRALNYVLAEADIGLADVAAIVCDTAYYYPPDGPPTAVFPEYPHPDRIVQLDHHLGHAASAFLPSPFDEAAILTVDASGGVAPLTASRRHWGFLPRDVEFRDRGGRMAHRHPTVAELLRERPDEGARNYPAESLTLGRWTRGERFVELEDQMAAGSLGYVYALCAHFLGMEEGSLMGLAGHGGPNEFDRAFAEILRLEPNGRLALDPSWLLFWSGERVLEDPVSFKRLSPKWFAAFGQPRGPHDEVSERDKSFAWSAQHRLEEALIHVARRLRELTPSPNLCVAGGVGLNSVANQKLLAGAGFERIFIQPAASDDGLALGYALFGDYVLSQLPREKRWTMTSAQTGRTPGEEEIASFFASVQSGRLPVEYLEAIPFTRRVDVLSSIDGGETQRTPMTYDERARRWRAELPVPVGAAAEYEFVSFGAPLADYEWREEAAPAVETPAPRPGLPPEFAKFLDDHRDLAGALDGERAFVGPEHVVIDPTNRCNNNCLPCWTNSPLLGDAGPPADWARREMPAEMLLRLIDDLAALGAKRVRFTGGGEPLLHPAIYDAIARAKRRGLLVALTTNFSAIGPNGVRRLVDAGLDELTVSLFAGTPTVYSRSHPNKTERTFEQIESNLRRFCASKPPGAQVILANVLFSMNFEETREMLDFALRVGADGIYYTVVDSVHARTDGLLLTPPHLEVLRAHLAEVKRRVDDVTAQGRAFRLDNWDGLQQRLAAVGAPQGEYDREAVEAIPCYVGWMFVRVLPTGEAAPCCRGVNKPLGDLRRRPFAEIWRDAPYQEFRRIALRESKRHRYFREIGCWKACDNLMHNRDFHARLMRLTNDEREQLRRFILAGEPRETR